MNLVITSNGSFCKLALLLCCQHLIFKGVVSFTPENALALLLGIHAALLLLPRQLALCNAPPVRLFGDRKPEALTSCANSPTLIPAHADGGRFLIHLIRRCSLSHTVSCSFSPFCIVRQIIKVLRLVKMLV